VRCDGDQAGVDKSPSLRNPLLPLITQPDDGKKRGMLSHLQNN
jgi:hypothetical protein